MTDQILQQPKHCLSMALKTSDSLGVVLSEPGARVYIEQAGRSRKPIRYETTDSGDLTHSLVFCLCVLAEKYKANEIRDHSPPIFTSNFLSRR